MTWMAINFALSDLKGVLARTMNKAIRIAERYIKETTNWTIDKSLEPYRRLTSSQRMMPSFMIIGAQKAGTTSLYNYLIEHPRIVPALKKELFFFDKKFDKGMNWYRSRFPFRNEALITGEATPTYIFHPHAPQRIKDSIPSIKLIVLLRNPVDRAISHYYHNLRYDIQNRRLKKLIGIERRETLSFEEAIEKAKRILSAQFERVHNNALYYSREYMHCSYLYWGMYAIQLERWMTIFPREQILILKSEDLFSKPQKIYKEALDFLELPTIKLKNHKIYNQSMRFKEVDIKVREKLVNFFEPHNESLYSNFRDFQWEGNEQL